MKIFKKSVTLLISALSACLFCSCMRSDYGLNLGSGIGGNSVYICNSISEEGLNSMGYTKEDYLKELEEEAEGKGYLRWESENVDFNAADGKHYVGTKFTKKISKKSIEKEVTDLVSDFAEVQYSERSSIGKRTVSITLTPKGGAWSDKQYSSYVGDTDEDYIDYYFTINTPTAITDTNGTLSSDGKSSEWNLEPLVEEKSDYLNMTVTYKSYSLLITTGIVFAVVVLAVVVVSIYLKKKSQESEFRVTTSSESISSMLAGGDDENTKRCPNCGYKLRLDEAFCVNCGEVFDSTDSSQSQEEGSDILL